MTVPSTTAQAVKPNQQGETMKLDGTTPTTRYTVKRVPEDTRYRHPKWQVLRKDGSLVCTCTHAVAAEACIEELLKNLMESKQSI